jgi:phage repressor protein C with HTH and peptisase S24 domain
MSDTRKPKSLPGPVGIALKRFVEPEGPWSMRALSGEAELSEKAVQAIIDGRSQNPLGKNVRKLAEVLKVPVPKLLDGTASPEHTAKDLAGFLETNLAVEPEAEPPQPRRMPLGKVPVMGTAAAGDDGFFEINLTEGGVVEWVDLPEVLSDVPQGDLFAIRVIGRSMLPLWREKDLVHVVKSRKVRADEQVVALVEMGPGQPPRALLKEFVRQTSKEVVLKQLNPYMEVVLPKKRVRNLWAALHWRDLQ